MNESALLLCGSSQLIRVEEITYTRQVMIYNSTSAGRLLGEEGDHTVSEAKAHQSS